MNPSLAASLASKLRQSAGAPNLKPNRKNHNPNEYSDGKPYCARCTMHRRNKKARAERIREISDDCDTAGAQVYFIEAEGIDRVKVGWTSRLPDRLKDLVVGCPVPIHVLGTVPGGAAKEREIHAALSDAHANGEWYVLSQVRERLDRAVFGEVLPAHIRTCPKCGRAKSRHARARSKLCKSCAISARAASVKVCDRCGAQDGTASHYGLNECLCSTCKPVVKAERAAIRRAKQSAAMQGNTNAVGRSARGKLLTYTAASSDNSIIQETGL